MPTGKHVKTEYEKLRGTYRGLCPRHVVTFEAVMTEDQKRHCFSYANDLRMLGNETVARLNKRLEQLFRTKRYCALKKDYGFCVEHIKNLDPKSKRYAELEANRVRIASEMSDMQKDFGITFNDVRNIVSELSSVYNVGSIFALTRGEDIWSACVDVLYGNGRHMHFRKRGELPIIRAKQSNRGITIGLEEEEIVFYLDGIGEFYADAPSRDYFLTDEYNAIRSFITNPEGEAINVAKMAETGEVISVFRPCYACIQCKEIRGKLRVFVMVTVAAPPMRKLDRFGNQRHVFCKTGRVGCDNGAQSFAVVSEDVVLLENTAERGGKSSKDREHLIRLRQRRMSASIRKTNPDRFNPDGTYKKGTSGKLKKSKHYKRKQYLVREQYRRDALSREYAVREAANRIRSLGDELIIEPSNAKSLQRKSKKPAEKSNQAIDIKKKDGTVKTVHKNKRKKRFGRSVLHRCPGAFQEELKKKFGARYYEVSKQFRASQYDHVLDDYIKKKLSERWHTFSDGTKVQRDLYSAFLMYCSNTNNTAPNRETCLKTFDSFFILHNSLIRNIIKNHYKVCNSGIKV